MYYDSFLYNGVNMLIKFGIKMIKHNSLLPPLRSRKIDVMNKSGSYDYGARTHGERLLTLECKITRQLEEFEIDELKYTLSRKGKIILYDTPDRHYIGQIYDSNEVIEHFRKSTQAANLDFTCEPYAESIEPTVVYSDGYIMPTSYKGTWRTPTRFTIRNTSKTKNLNGITITSKVKKQ